MSIAQDNRWPVKPIETRYKGYRFRSRLEARWAVYFDTVRFEWEYEPEGFEVQPGVWYLPDFWFPGLKLWGEVKPTEFTGPEAAKAVGLVWATKRGLIKLIGTPDCKTYGVLTREDDEVAEVDVPLAHWKERNRLYWNPGYSTARIPVGEIPAVVRAVDAARGARFNEWKAA